VKSVHVRFRKYGLPTGNITVNIRKGTDDTVAATLGSYPVESFPANVESTFIVRLRSNTWNMVANDQVSVEFPSNATNGFEISANSVASNPTNYTGHSFNGTTWSNTSDPPAITIKG
jgi:hypothetical protein